MKRIPLLFLAAITLIAVSCNYKNADDTASGKPITKDSLIKRGKYLVTMIGCSDCHSPKKFGPQGPQPDPELLLSGHPSSQPLPPVDTSMLKNWVAFNMTTTAFVGPWGVSYASNITSDNSGIGSWTEQQFFKALREGKSKGLDGNRMLLPPMPWPAFGQATDEDLRAIFEFLKSTKPIKNIVPQPIPPTQIAQLK